jgi:two-component sensor histidine kinase
LTEDETLSVIDRDGIILVRQPDWENHIGRPISHEFWTRLTTATVPFDFEARSPVDGVMRIFGVIPPVLNPGGLAISIGLNRDAAFAPLDDANLREILVIAGGALFAFLLAWLIGLRLVRAPIEGLLETTRRWRGGDLAARTGQSGSTELGQLGEAFDAMADDLQQAMHAKDMLLRELNHRVMNSLQTISALFSLQARSLRDPDARAKFNDAVSRINSIAVAYRRIHTSGGVETIEFSEFLRELCADIGRSLMPEEHACRVTSDSILLGSQQASSLALIVNELVTNAVKHGDKNSPIEVTFAQTADGHRLSVRNAGVLPPDYDSAGNSGFGMRMVNMLAEQLGGRLEVSSAAGHTEFTVILAPAGPEATPAATAEDRMGSADKASA